MDAPGDVENFLDEVKSMLEISDYHENIVNLQGVIYGKEDVDKRLPKVDNDTFLMIN